mmetsp:Transcript_35151/g.48764  ORF Transcript_35151/g.48764 Transcript_35151/m.48764 type:complete len:395 (+) Transcript_35151:137-1321(+)
MKLMSLNTLYLLLLSFSCMLSVHLFFTTKLVQTDLLKLQTELQVSRHFCMRQIEGFSTQIKQFAKDREASKSLSIEQDGEGDIYKTNFLKHLHANGIAKNSLDVEYTSAAFEDKLSQTFPQAPMQNKHRVNLLRQDPKHTLPLPPLQIEIDDGQHKLAFVRKRGGYGGDASDAAHIGGWMRNDTNGYEPKLWDWMIERLRISSFIDVGCGAGLVTKHFLDRGVDALCVEASNEAINVSFAPRDRIVQHDFTRGPWFPSGGRVVDVAYTVEFLEHVEEKYLDNVVSLLKSARYLFMSASEQGGWSHMTVHKRWWWIERMESYGFAYSAEMTQILQRLTLGGQEIKRGYAYLKHNGLVFRNPEVDSENAFKEHGTMEARKILWNKRKDDYLARCKC